MSLLTNVLKLWRTGQYLLPADSGFSPKHLLAGRVGWWLDPLDFRYARQDSAGATAYTAVEQGVGMAVDKSANGLTFVQASGPAKPVVSARVNFLIDSEYISGTSGTGTLTSLTGYSAAVHIDLGGANVTAYRSAVSQPPFPALYTISATVKMDSGAAPAFIGPWNSATTDFALLVCGFVPSGFTSTLLSSGIYRTSANFSLPSAGGSSSNGPVKTPTNSANGFTISGNDLRFASRNNLPYQKTTSSSYDTAGFPHYLKFDGAATNLVGASGGGASTGFYFGAAVQFGKVGAVQTIVSDAGTNTGFKIRTTAANQIEISAGNGAAFTAVNTTETFAAGDVAFIELFDNGTNLSACLGNGTTATVARPAVSAGTAQMTLGKANNTASEYSGVSIFSAVYLKDYCPTAAERADYKRWALQRAGVAS